MNRPGRLSRWGRQITFVMAGLLALATPAQADFRKALEAYQNRDGDKLLAEVRDAVEKKNDDGLILVSMATNPEEMKSENSGNENLYYEQLKQEVTYYEIRPDEDMAKLGYSTCATLTGKAGKNQKLLYQAYLWCVFADKQRGIVAATEPSRGFAISNMRTSGELRNIDPTLDRIWSDKKQFANHLNNMPLPDLLVEVRRELAKTNRPIFAVYYRDQYSSHMEDSKVMEIYSDGRVKFTIDRVVDAGKLLVNNITEIQSNPQTVGAFMQELKRIGFYDWIQPTNEVFGAGVCDLACEITEIRVIAREGGNVQRFYSETDYDYKDGREPPPDKYVESVKRYKNSLHIAKLKVLIERFFPTRELRCVRGKSEIFSKECMKREQLWENLVKGEK